jgi:hypothetical protein
MATLAESFLADLEDLSDDEGARSQGEEAMGVDGDVDQVLQQLGRWKRQPVFRRPVVMLSPCTTTVFHFHAACMLALTTGVAALVHLKLPLFNRTAQYCVTGLLLLPFDPSTLWARLSAAPRLLLHHSLTT